MKRSIIYIATTALLLVLLLSPAAVNELLAAGDDTIGYTVTSAEPPLVLTGNNIYTTGTANTGLKAMDSGVIEMTGGTIKTDGFEAHGAWTLTNGSITMTDVDIEVNSFYTQGVQSDSAGTIIMNGGSVSTIGNFSAAFYITARSQATLTDVEISTTGIGAGGVYANGSGTVVNINGGSITTLHRDNIGGSNATNGAYGVISSGGSLVNLTDVTISTDKINTTSGYTGSHGIYSQANSTINMTRGVIDTNTAASSHGVYANGSLARANLSGTSVTTGGTGSHGLYANGSNASISADNVTVHTSGNSSHGLYANGTNASVSADNVTVHTSGNSSNGLFAFGSGSYMTADRVTVSTSGDYSNGLRAQGTNAYISADNVTVRTSGNYANGVTADNFSTVYLKNADIETTGENSAAVYANSSFARIMINGATISADSTKDSLAIYAAGWTGGDATTRAYVLAEEALYNIHGLIRAAYNSSIDITMGEGSVFTGYTSTFAHDDGTLDMRINGASSVWNVTDGSVLTNLTLDGGSTVNLSASDRLGTVVRTENLNDGAVPAGLPITPAGGILIMKADIEREFADNLVVGDTANGTHYITVAPDAKASTTGKELTTLIVIEGQDNSTFSLTSGTVDAGGWTYALRQRTNALYDAIIVPAIWELYCAGASDPGSDAVNTFYGAYLLGYAETNTLIQRLGDLRATPHENGLWFRVHGGSFETGAKNYVKGFDMDYGGVHIGYDRKLENIGWDGDAYAGIYFGYSRGELDYTSHGDATVDSKMLGAYATFIKPNGFYLDAILKYQWMNNEFDSFDSAGNHVTANDVNTGGFGFSVEAGQRIPFGRGQKTGWYMEPQVQLTYQRYGDGTYECIDGLRVSVDGFTSILGRLGALIGYETEKSNLYAKIARIREFDGDVNAIINDCRIHEDFSGSWWVYGIGYTSRLNEKNSVYLDVERTSGASFKQEWSARAGWRIVF